MADLAVWLLGPFKAELNGVPLRGFRSRKTRALLAYLSVESHRPWARTTLAGLLWPDFSEKAALSNLRNALANLRHVIEDNQSDSPFLCTSPSTIQFIPSQDFWLDFQVFLNLVPASDSVIPVNVDQLEQALSIFQGDFMEGFSIDSTQFEEWVLANREQIHRKLLRIIRLLVLAHKQNGEIGTALNYSYRWTELEPWDEAAYRLRMQLLVTASQRSAALTQYEELCSRLEQDLNIAPEPETVQLYEQIRSGQAEKFLRTAFPSSESVKIAAKDPGPLPKFLVENTNIETRSKLFVARKQELRQLGNGLEKVINGEGQVFFVTGEPGSGKTALMAEFSRQVLQMRTDMLVFWGQCNAYTGKGDPYFPFLNITRQFAGEVEALLTGGMITMEHIQRLWEYLPETVSALLDHGTELINACLSGEERMSLARLHPGVNPNLLEQLDVQIKIRSEGKARSNFDQLALFEHFANMVSSLAQNHPILIIFDDLQWIDSGSVDLLFHVCRKLAGKKIFILGSFRPEDVSLGRNGEPHPLIGVVQELRVIFGDIQVDLMQSNGLEFTETLVDSEPNELSPEFRKLFFQKASGHPLFSIELLRGMQLRGEIIHNNKGKWIEGPKLNWDKLPARVEAVIARRILLLPKEYQEILNIACVEGEQFSTEIIARVLGKDEQLVYGMISQEIGKRHLLVVAQGLQRIGEQKISNYRFRHLLFQVYLYNHLDVVEKARLHGMIGSALEQIYQQEQEMLPEIANKLARHFESAGILKKAVKYYTQAGKNALRLSANHEAIDHFYHALHLLEALPSSSERDLQELDLQLSLGHPLTAVKGWAPPELAATYERAQDLCLNIKEPSHLIPALWLLATYRLGRSEHTDVDRLSKRFYNLAKQANDPLLLSLASLQVSSFYQGRFRDARETLERAIKSRNLIQQRILAQKYGMSPTVVGLAYLADTLWMLGFPEQADRSRLEALELAEKVKHPLTLCYALARSCWLNITMGDIEMLQDQTRKLNLLTQNYGFKTFEFASIVFDSWVHIQSGKADIENIDQMYEAIENYSATGTILNRSSFLVLFSRACGQTGILDRGLNEINQSIQLAEKTGELWYQAEAFREKGKLFLQQGFDIQNAEDSFINACQIAKKQGAIMLELRATVDLCQLWQRQGKDAVGRESLTQVYAMFTEGFETKDLKEAKAILAKESVS